MDDESDVSGIFTNADTSLGATDPGKRRSGDDDASDIVPNYPGLDDDSVMISEIGDDDDASSGIYTKQSDMSSAAFSAGMGALFGVPKKQSKDFEKLYDIENSVSDGNTDVIMGEYGMKDSASSRKNPFDDGDSTKIPLPYDQPMKTMPTDVSSPDRSEGQRNKAVKFDKGGSGASPSREEEEPSKLCGMPVKRVIMISGYLVVIAFIVAIVSVVVSGQDDGGDRVAPLVTMALTSSPVMPEPPSECLPDDDKTEFTVTDEVVNCAWLREKDDLLIQLVCEEKEEALLICSKTCVCGRDVKETESPVVAPTASPTSRPTRAPSVTSVPTAPTSQPTGIPTSSPTEFPTEVPTPRPTNPPSPAPTQAPSPSPTSSPTEAPNSPTQNPTASQGPTAFTTTAPTPFVTRPQMGTPTAQPTVTLNCEDDRPGTIPSSPPFWTCFWLSQVNPTFRRQNCQPGTPAFSHCPTTCRSCAP